MSRICRHLDPDGGTGLAGGLAACHQESGGVLAGFCPGTAAEQQKWQARHCASPLEMGSHSEEACAPCTSLPDPRCPQPSTAGHGVSLPTTLPEKSVNVQETKRSPARAASGHSCQHCVQEDCSCEQRQIADDVPSEAPEAQPMSPDLPQTRLSEVARDVHSAEDFESLNSLSSSKCSANDSHAQKPCLEKSPCSVERSDMQQILERDVEKVGKAEAMHSSRPV